MTSPVWSLLSYDRALGIHGGILQTHIEDRYYLTEGGSPLTFLFQWWPRPEVTFDSVALPVKSEAVVVRTLPLAPPLTLSLTLLLDVRARAHAHDHVVRCVAEGYV